MKSWPLILSVLVLLVLPTSAWNQTTNGRRAATASKDESEIRALLDRWAKAFEARDIDLIMSNYGLQNRVCQRTLCIFMAHPGRPPQKNGSIEEMTCRRS